MSVLVCSFSQCIFKTCLLPLCLEGLCSLLGGFAWELGCCDTRTKAKSFTPLYEALGSYSLFRYLPLNI